jgi:hypothetical protein
MSEYTPDELINSIVQVIRQHHPADNVDDVKKEFEGMSYETLKAIVLTFQYPTVR